MGKVVTKKALKNVHFLPFQPYDDIAHVFSVSVVGLGIPDSRSGVCVPTDDKRALVAAISDMINNEKLTHQYATNGRRYVVEELSRASGTLQYVRCIADTVAGSSSKVKS